MLQLLPMLSKIIIGLSVSLIVLSCSDSKAKPKYMTEIKGGCFTMGASQNEPGAADSEKPNHEVCLEDFFMDKSLVTQAQFEGFMKTNPSTHKTCPDCPVESITWQQANDYCKKAGYRLPTEAEWEYAARAGTQTLFFWGNEFDKKWAWYFENSNDQTRPVMHKEANPWGLYDMLGNVWEWTSDWSTPNYYAISPRKNPKGPKSGTDKIIRGGSYKGKIRNLRVAKRGWQNPQIGLEDLGFRCVKSK